MEVMTTMTRSGKMRMTAGAQGLEKAETLARSSLSEQAELVEWRNSPQKRGRDEDDDEEDEMDKYWNCTRRRVECVWPR